MILLAACAPAVEVAEGNRPNVLLVIVDDLSDWVGCLEGHPDARTPRIDSLASSGVLFTNAHAQAPICNPSRTSFMLGLRPSTTGIYQNSPWFRDVPELKERETLLQCFRQQGYRTFAAGKVFHASRNDPASIDVEGPTPGQRSPLDERVKTDKRWGMWDFGPQGYAESEFVDSQVVSWASERLREDHAQPFFITVGLYKPHVPLYAPSRLFEPERRPLELLGKPVDDLSDVPPIALAMRSDSAPSNDWFQTRDRSNAATNAYLATTTFVDEQVGRLLDALASGPHSNNTIVVLFSDHGMHMGEKTVWGKRTLWERSTRVPLIFSIPGGSRGVRVEQTTELLSLFPTLIELCGLEAPPGADFDASSLAGLLDQTQPEWTDPAITSVGANDHAVRTQRWRYIRYADGSEELYDHDSDPHEWVNLATDPKFDAELQSLRDTLPSNAATDLAETVANTRKR
ncbi:MAG: choline-sulfatase [Planctomycetota bacterium]|jgi:choline-sulfatase